MASEDSDQLLSGCSSIHRLCDARDLCESVRIAMPLFGDDLHAFGEPLKVRSLRRMQRMLAKERHNRLEQVISPTNDKPAQMLTVIIVTFRDVDVSNPEEASKLLERRHASDALRHDKLV